jgi:hypothetical protein
VTAWGAGMFWSQSAKGWLGFVATLSDNRLCLAYEMTFIRTSPEDAASQIKTVCRVQGIPLPIIYAQPAIFPQADTHGETVSETFARAGVPMIAGDDDRINGLSRIRSWLQPRDGKPSLVIHADCKYFLRTFPTLIEDPKEPDDIIETPDAYPAHGLRFFLMSRPAPHAPQPVIGPQPGTWGYELRHVYTPQRRFLGESLR